MKLSISLHIWLFGSKYNLCNNNTQTFHLSKKKKKKAIIKCLIALGRESLKDSEPVPWRIMNIPINEEK